jgi:uncharacterized protein DUF2442
MSFSASSVHSDERVMDVQFTENTISVGLVDGRVITVPLVWYPRLLGATAAQRKNWKITGGGFGIHWPDIDEDLSTEGLLRGAPAPRFADTYKESRSSGVESHTRYGYGVEAWERAKAEAIKEIGSQAKRESTITYSDLTQRIHSVTVGPSDYAFHSLLYEISKEEDAAGRGLLSALVVRKEDGMPGQGYFNLAQELGRDVTDPVRSWTEEIKLVFAKWH